MHKFRIQPLADRVLVKADIAKEKSKGGIIIPDNAKEKPQKGIILAVGKGKKDEPMTVKVGDVVLYGKYSGTEITVDDIDALIMKESDILGIIQPTTLELI
ncbi:co-chaperone GroES [Aquimarina algiphila]|uniref:Co-chaperonin GroES n=1 Tax=Aquimarina algiphila TaxID=2047982 RepID=A0A554VK56_9FLAO|nr:co-chaperone GroES [Aquimarina algiphila]TSE08367.1 co-chaperone GroES [Aquimarina algiphila]